MFPPECPSFPPLYASQQFGHRRDALGQKWMIDLEGGVWMVGCDRRAWRVDSNMDILVLETARGRGSSSGDEARWLVERSTGIQWLVDEKCDRIRAATKKEAIRVPPDVRKALKVEAKDGRAGPDEDSDVDVASSRSGSPVTSTMTTRSKRTRASAESRKRRAKEEEELSSERRTEKGSGSETLESGEESVSSGTEEERRRKKKKSRKTELSGSPSFLRGEMVGVKRESFPI